MKTSITLVYKLENKNDGNRGATQDLVYKKNFWYSKTGGVPGLTTKQYYIYKFSNRLWPKIGFHLIMNATTKFSITEYDLQLV